MNREIPQFNLRCIKSDYPQHLIPNVVYKVDTIEKNDEKEPSVFWFHPVENKWVFIGYFPVSCFDISPIKKYINQKKGIEEPVARERQVVPVARERIPVQRERQVVRQRI